MVYFYLLGGAKVLTNFSRLKSGVVLYFIMESGNIAEHIFLANLHVSICITSFESQHSTLSGTDFTTCIRLRRINCSGTASMKCTYLLKKERKMREKIALEKVEQVSTNSKLQSSGSNQILIYIIEVFDEINEDIFLL